MHKDQGNGIRSGTSFVDEVDCHGAESVDVDGESELWELGVEGGFVGAPGVVVEPVVAETFDFGEGRAVWG
jgi:hypothetical protein